jgi:hypothetical protein
MTLHSSLLLTLKIIVATLGLLVVSYLFFLWLVFFPFRLAYRLHAPARSRDGFPELTALAALATSVVALLRSRRGEDDYPAGWHPCENPQCRGPIANTSRARYCSEPCRRYTRVRMQHDWGEHPFDTTLVMARPKVADELPEDF